MARDWTEILADLPHDRAVFVAGGCACPTGLLSALAERPDLLRGRRIVTSFLPGINRVDPAAGADGPPVAAVFPVSGLPAERQTLIPLAYSDLPLWLARECGAVLFQGAHAPGGVNLGLAADFVPGLAASGVPLVAEVNPAHPSLPGAPTLPVAAEVGIETPLVTYDPRPVGTAFTRIGEHVAALIRDGDTVQLGLGRVQPAVLSALTVAGTRFSLHGGMLSTAALPAIEAGGVERIVAGMVLGNAALYARVPTLDNLALLPVAQTHGAAVLARIPNLVAVNSALAVDLAGQATSESLAGRAVSAAGGIDDFQRGARASAGGRAILALPATARGASRIVAALPAGTRISVTAPNADIVVTEHGVAHLRGQTLAERARRLTAIAAPEHRDTLRAAACAA